MSIAVDVLRRGPLAMRLAPLLAVLDSIQRNQCALDLRDSVKRG
jgi:hypothetical protein